MAEFSSVVLVFLIVFGALVSSLDGRRLLDVKESKKRVYSLSDSLFLSALPKGTVPSSTPARSMTKPFSHFSSTHWAFANPPTPLSAYTFADPPPPLNGEEKLILDIKIATAIAVLVIFIVILIRKLRECNSGSGSSASECGGVINSHSLISIQLPALNADDDGSVIA